MTSCKLLNEKEKGFNKNFNMECQFCESKNVEFDGEDESGHLNYYCKDCGEPQDD